MLAVASEQAGVGQVALARVGAQLEGSGLDDLHAVALRRPHQRLGLQRILRLGALQQQQLAPVPRRQVLGQRIAAHLCARQGVQQVSRALFAAQRIVFQTDIEDHSPTQCGGCQLHQLPQCGGWQVSQHMPHAGRLELRQRRLQALHVGNGQLDHLQAQAQHVQFNAGFFGRHAGRRQRASVWMAGIGLLQPARRIAHIV